MPVYEYECLKCGSRFEEIQKFSDEPLAKHDGCGGRVKRLLSAPAFQFKGSGWYITDYARKGSGGAKSEGDSKAEGQTGKADGKTESTTSASKAESKSKDTTTTS
jgi:putative FmdB family regulatory protein